MNALIRKIENQAVYIRNVPEEYHFERDPKDECYVNYSRLKDESFLSGSPCEQGELIACEVPSYANIFGRASYLH